MLTTRQRGAAPGSPFCGDYAAADVWYPASQTGESFPTAEEYLPHLCMLQDGLSGFALAFHAFWVQLRLPEHRDETLRAALVTASDV